ncbi:S41 family peptidase [Sphingomonas sp. ASY06-1R]|uniref:S41 family peptidase n=1 Tax=Sphingomonas sp. ASY06-1R TaxID=3445771 RepID=UPI003FA20EC8
MSSFPSRRAVLRGAAMIGTHAMMGRAGAAQLPNGDFSGDAELLARAYGALHPGLYRYNSPSQMGARFLALRQTLAARPTLSDAYLALARCTAAVRCGHSYPNFYNQSDAVQRGLFDRPDKLPFLFRWIGDRMIVTRDVSQPPLPPGTEVRAIEGVPAGRLLRGLMPYARADGHNDAKRRRILEVEAIDRFQAFDIYAPMLWPAMFARRAMRITATLPDGRSLRRDVALITLAQRQAAVPPIDAQPRDAILWSLDRKPGGVACLTMRSWSVYNGRWDWASWLEARLDEIVSDGTRTLIVDLRGNEGGLDCGNAILARLVDRPLTPLRMVARVRARRVPEDIRPHVDTWDKSFYDWGDRVRGPQRDGFFALAADADDAYGGLTIHPAGRRFRGTLIVLTDASNSSATFGFAQLVKASRLGLLIGEPTGGNRRGINGGAFLFLRLPASGIEADLPLIGYFPSGDQPDAGILPDICVEESAADIAAGFDRTMAVALRRARSLA